MVKVSVAGNKEEKQEQPKIRSVHMSIHMGMSEKYFRYFSDIPRAKVATKKAETRPNLTCLRFSKKPDKWNYR
jgi:hypothetical protein